MQYRISPFSGWLEGKQECPDRVVMNSRAVPGVRQPGAGQGPGAEQNLVATTYWWDTTEADDLRERYTATRPVLAILMVDNYEDLMKHAPILSAAPCWPRSTRS